MFTFRAMNVDVEVTAYDRDEEATAAEVASTFWSAECRFSRFRDDSELSQLNRSQGRVGVSRELFAALLRARSYVELTCGIFDPAIGSALVAHGYDRSFMPGALDREGEASPVRVARLGEVALDAATCTVERPEHIRIDLGGMIKGATVDAAAACLRGAGVVDAGGDAVLRGHGPDGNPWFVDIEDPKDASHTLATLRVSNRAVATSAANRRSWRVGHARAHHLLDPRTQRPAMSDLVQVTVLAKTAELAEVLAKTVFVLGEHAGQRFLDAQRDVGAVVVRDDGRTMFWGEVDAIEVSNG